MIFKRPVLNTQDRKEYPWAFHCSKEGCYYMISATSEQDAKVKEWKHGRGKNVCPFIGAYYENGVRIR